MILTDHPTPVRFVCRLHRPVYAISARQVRNACVIGLLGGFLFMALVVAFTP